MVAVNHIPHLVHTQTAFVWRFLALSAGESQIIHVTAWTEREARSRCPSGCVAVFAANPPGSESCLKPSVYLPELLTQ